jgi:hypothetical protein
VRLNEPRDVVTDVPVKMDAALELAEARPRRENSARYFIATCHLK